MLAEAYFKSLGEVAIVEIFELLKSSMELRRMNSHTEEFNLANVAMLMHFAMQFSIDIEKYNTQMK